MRLLLDLLFLKYTAPGLNPAGFPLPGTTPFPIWGEMRSALGGNPGETESIQSLTQEFEASLFHFGLKESLLLSQADLGPVGT